MALRQTYEPAARGARETTSARPAPGVETTPPDLQAVPTVPEPSEALVAVSQPSVPEEEPSGESIDRFEPAASTPTGAERVATAAPEVSPEPRAGGEDGSRAVVPPSPEFPETVQSAAPAHPVRKVLRWLSVVPHRVETPEDGASPADSRVDADAA